MRRNSILLLFLFFLLCACASKESSAATQKDVTPTCDPCSPGELPKQVEPITDLLTSFDDTLFVSAHTPQAQLAEPIMQLQNLRRQLMKLEVPHCVEKLKEHSLDYMNSVIIYLTYFMGGAEKEIVDEGIQSSQIIRDILDGEYQNLLGVAYLPSQTNIPDTGALMATAQVTPSVDATIVVKNESDEKVNIRSLPKLSAPIIGGMLPGEILIGFGKDETSEWVMVEFNEKIGWVNASVVSLNYSLNILPVVPND